MLALPFPVCAVGGENKASLDPPRARLEASLKLPCPVNLQRRDADGRKEWNTSRVRIPYVDDGHRCPGAPMRLGTLCAHTSDAAPGFSPSESLPSHLPGAAVMRDYGVRLTISGLRSASVVGGGRPQRANGPGRTADGTGSQVSTPVRRSRPTVPFVPERSRSRPVRRGHSPAALPTWVLGYS